MKTQAKYILVRDSLLRDVRYGKYKEGDRMPSERDLAKQYDVSYMTARKAVSQLVESGFLEPRNREGVFLSANAVKRTQKRTFHLICTAYEAPSIQDFLRTGQRLAAERSANSHIIRVNENQSRLVVQALKSGDPCLVVADVCLRDKSVIAAMQEATSNLVVIGENMTPIGLNSVTCDKEIVSRMMIDHLKENGHERISLIVHDLIESRQQRIASTWKASFPNEDQKKLEKRLLVGKVRLFECSSAPTYEAVKAYIMSPDFDATAFVCMNYEATLGAVAACREAGLKIPEDISFVNCGNPDLMKFACPPITCADINMPRYVELAMDILDQKESGVFQRVEPSLIQRKSVFNRSGK